MRRANSATGLEAAPDIMLLIMAALMVAIVWLVSQASEATLPPIDLPSGDGSQLGIVDAAALNVTLRPVDGGGIEVFVDESEIAGGLDALEGTLRDADASAITLRADARVSWAAALEAMSAAARLGLRVSIAAER